jgi:hypothetical protein
MYSNFREMNMTSSKELDDHYQSDASRTTAFPRNFPPLTNDEKRTYQKWKRATFIVYGAVAIIIVTLSIAIGPTENASTGKNEMYSSLAPTAGKSH